MIYLEYPKRNAGKGSLIFDHFPSFEDVETPLIDHLQMLKQKRTCHFQWKVGLAFSSPFPCCTIALSGYVVYVFPRQDRCVEKAREGI